LYVVDVGGKRLENDAKYGGTDVDAGKEEKPEVDKFRSGVLLGDESGVTGNTPGP